MADKTLYTVIQLRRGTHDEWESVKSTFIPAAGEACVTTTGTYAGQVKFGNGTDNWGTLKYAGIVSGDGTSIQSVNGILSIPGYEAASVGQMLKKGTNGVEWVNLTPESIGAVRREITTNGSKSLIFNESDGGGAKFEHSDGTEAFVGVNNGGENGMMAQIYADKWDSEHNKWVGSRINVYHDKIYYQSKADTENNIDKDDASLEIATIGDIQNSTAVIEKQETAESGFLATYVLKVNGVLSPNSAKINIPKDYLVKSGSVETVETEDEPYEGAAVGDKYIDFIVNTSEDDGSEQHIYIPVNELIDVYTAGNGIEIGDNNTISAKVVAANGLSVNSNGIELGLASETVAGAMSAADKVVLNGLANNSVLDKTQHLTTNGTLSTDYLDQGTNKLILDGGSAS